MISENEVTGASMIDILLLLLRWLGLLILFMLWL